MQKQAWYGMFHKKCSAYLRYAIIFPKSPCTKKVEKTVTATEECRLAFLQALAKLAKKRAFS